MPSFRRLGRARTCPICNRPGRCMLSTDATMAICARVASGEGRGKCGWLHKLTGRKLVESQCLWQPSRKSRNGPPHFEQVVEHFRVSSRDSRLCHYAQRLRVRALSLRRLGIGWDGTAWCFPMYDATRSVIGMHRLHRKGNSLRVPQSQHGLFIPRGFDNRAESVFVCVGPTNCAGLLDFGLTVVGKPIANRADALLAAFLEGKEVNIVSAHHQTSMDGAQRCLETVAPCVSNARIVTIPGGHGSISDWRKETASDRHVERWIAACKRLQTTK